MSGVLEGFRVVDWTVWQAGPGASMMLGDLGADVIKIEDRVTGDPSRGLEQGYAVEHAKNRQGYYECNNRNKRGIVLDVGKEEGREIMYRLVEKADVFVTNFRPSVITRYGMDYETLIKYNPRLVYGAITGYGSRGPDADVRSYDGLGQARAGLMTLADPDAPRYLVGGLGDAAAGIMCAYGVLAGLLARERQGIGQKVEASLLSSLLFWQWVGLGFQFIAKFPAGPRPRHRPMNPLLNQYKCADGKWIFVYHPQADRFWPNFCKALGIEKLQKDPRYDSIAKRHENEEFVRMLDRIFATKTRDEWAKVLRENDCVFGNINTMDDLATDPMVVANNYLPQFDHPVWGKTTFAPIPIELSKTPGALWRPAPEHGQHTEEVLAELLGYTWDQIAKLKASEVI